jgi:hypothetical protein
MGRFRRRAGAGTELRPQALQHIRSSIGSPDLTEKAVDLVAETGQRPLTDALRDLPLGHCLLNLSCASGKRHLSQALALGVVQAADAAQLVTRLPLIKDALTMEFTL